MTAKRAVDVLIAGSAMIVLAPVFLCVAVAVRLSMGRPVLFRQTRPGLDARPFALAKFRTMRDASGPDGQPLPDGERLTSVGRTLRATSLDELPQLWNVLIGDMSLVGPRPLLTRYLPRYSTEQMRRHAVRPGLTGWAQVRGRNSLSWSEKFALDLWYVDHRSMLLDLRILAMTVDKVLRRRGISAADSATMDEFMGDEDPLAAAGDRSQQRRLLDDLPLPR